MATAAALYTVRVVGSSLPELVGKELRLGAGAAFIGRAEECEMAVGDPAMSRRHAKVEFTPQGLKLTDNGSANGVFVNGQRTSEIFLGPGDRFLLGSTTFEVVGPEPARPPVVFTPDRTMAISDIRELAAQFEKPTSFEELGERVVTAANRPLLLNDPDTAWLVVSGKVEIFTIAVSAGQPVGARTHFVSVEPGRAFFGLDTDRYGEGSGFLAVGRAGSELRKYSVARLLNLAAIPAHGKRLAELLGGWVEVLSARLTKDFPLPPPDVAAVAGEPVQLPAGKKLVCEQKVAWVEMPAARFLFDGMASISWESEGVLFPLASGSWLELLDGEKPVDFLPRPTAQAIGDPRLWAGLEVFHRLLCECEFLNKRLAMADEFDRLERKAEQIEVAKEVAYGAIGSVLGGTGIWERRALGPTDGEPVMRAFRLIAERLGATVRDHPDSKEKQASFDDAVLGIATASRIRVRKVALAPGWFERDGGPLLAQIEATQVPVAVLPTSPESYEAVDAATGKKTAVDDEYAKTLAPFGYTFYRGLGDKALRVKDFIRFGMRGMGPDFRMVALMGCGLGLMGMLAPMVTGQVFDTAIPQAERGLLIQYSLGIFLVALGQAAFKVTQSIAILRVQGKLNYSLQASVWDRLLELPMTFFRKHSAGDLVDRAMGVDAMRQIVAGAGVSAILGSFSSIFNVVQMVGYSMKLAAVAIGLTLVFVLLTMVANYVRLFFQRDEQRRRGRISGLVLQLISGVSKLRVSGTENHAFRVWATEFADQRKVSFKVGRLENMVQVLNAGFPTLSQILIFLTAASIQQAAAGRGEEGQTLTTGQFLAFSAAYGTFLGAMQALGEASLSMLRIVPVWERLRPIVQGLPEIDASKAFPQKLRGEMEISHVSFRYSQESPYILKDLSLKIRPGEFVALVGGSGCGKSTLLRVLLGFEKAEKGSVYYDGQDMSSVDLRLLRAQLGVVLQDSRVLPADIYRNIVGNSSRTIQEAWDAAAMAGLAEDVKAMPMQMHTIISEGGGGLSGGQKQRLMIARSLVNKPKILFLDEATSALDNKTQAMVTESIDKLHATRIVIAHRLSTIINADRICYLEAGEIKEMGTFQELMEKNGQFAQLARRQMA